MSFAVSQSFSLELPDPPVKDNRIVSLTKQGAEDYCKKRGKSLPTARQLAEWAQAQGTAGIKNATGKTGYDLRVEMSEMRSKGYEPVYHVDRYPEISVDFYFSRRGYKDLPPNSILAGGGIWVADTRRLALGRQSYAFTPGSPSFTPTEEGYEMAFTCVDAR